MDDPKKNKNQVTVTFGSFAGRLLPSPLKLQLLTSVSSKIKFGDNPFSGWRQERGADVAEMAAALGLNIERYKKFEQGQYRGLDEETVTRFCALFDIHPCGLLQPGVPMPEALLNVLVERLNMVNPYSEDHEFCVRALQGEEEDAYNVLSLAREDSVRRSVKLVGPFLDLLEKDFAIGGGLAMTPGDVATVYLNDVHRRLAALEEKTKKPAFIHDDIWRSFNDAALHLYGSGHKVVQHLESLRGLFRRFSWEWDNTCEMVRQDPEVLQPLLWQDDMGARFVGGKLLSREDAVEAMLVNYKANQDRDRALATANGAFNLFRSDTKNFEHWLKSNDAGALFAYWRNRQVAHAALGAMQDGRAPALEWLPPAANRPKLA